jgi:hypothetical protein
MLNVSGWKSKRTNLSICNAYGIEISAGHKRLYTNTSTLTYLCFISLLSNKTKEGTKTWCTDIYNFYIKTVPLYAMLALGEEEVLLLLIINLGNRWGWVVRVKPRPPITLWERTPGTQFTGGWVGPRSGLKTHRLEDKFLRLCRGSNLDRIHKHAFQFFYLLYWPIPVAARSKA